MPIKFHSRLLLLALILGFATITRDGMTCGQVQHEFTKGEGQSYRLLFCKTSDGSWKVAFQ
jgi:hypothetical protein